MASPEPRPLHIIHLCGDLMGKGHLTRCGIRECPVDRGVHIVGQWKYVNCRDCLAKRVKGEK